MALVPVTSKPTTTEVGGAMSSTGCAEITTLPTSCPPINVSGEGLIFNQLGAQKVILMSCSGAASRVKV